MARESIKIFFRSGLCPGLSEGSYDAPILSTWLGKVTPVFSSYVIHAYSVWKDLSYSACRSPPTFGPWLCPWGPIHRHYITICRKACHKMILWYVFSQFSKIVLGDLCHKIRLAIHGKCFVNCLKYCHKIVCESGPWSPCGGGECILGNSRPECSHYTSLRRSICSELVV